MTRPCPACQEAKTRRHGEYRNGCEGCTVRAVAGGPDFFVATREGLLTPAYRRLLQDVFGGGWYAAHELVKTESARLRALG